ncbi:MAG: Na+/H+ antiporter NhaC family protein [Bacteroidota bacterium]
MGPLSLLPPLVAIALAILTRQVFLSLSLGIFLGYTMLAGWNPMLGFLDSIEACVAVFQDAGNTRTILFCALVGGLIVFMQRSGGVAGFIDWVSGRLERYESRGGIGSRVMVQLLAWLTGALIFVESSISVLTVGALYRPLFDKLGISREKLAYIADSSSAPSSILIPLNGWGAFLMGLLAAEGFANPFSTLIQTIPYNFYALLALFIVPAIILSCRDFGPMRQAEARAAKGQVLREGATPMVDEQLTAMPAKQGVKPWAGNMILPIVIMVALMPIMLAYTGWSTALELEPNGSFGSLLFLAIGKGSGSTAVLVAVSTSLVLSMLLYKAQGIFGIRESVELILKGIAGLMPLAILMMLAFAIGTLCKQELNTGGYVAGLVGDVLSPGLVPALVFIITCFIAFSVGSSWGTFAIMLPIAVPLAEQLDAEIIMTVAAVMGGGVFGDHCSPISDTTILSSMASTTDHVDHVKTQLPYALVAGVGAVVLYAILG